MLVDAGKDAGVYLKFHFNEEGQFGGAYCGESISVIGRFKKKQPKSLHRLGDILAGVITRGDDLDKPDTCGLEGVIALLAFRANLGSSEFQSMQHPSHNLVRCGAHTFMVHNEIV
jgi:hypothetical protein